MTGSDRMTRYRIKIVPKATPNADGEWIEVETAEPASEAPMGTTPRAILSTWREAELHFQSHIPDGFFMVKYEKL